MAQTYSNLSFKRAVPLRRWIFLIVSLLAIMGGMLLWRMTLLNSPKSPPLGHNTTLPTAPAVETKQLPWRLSIASIKINATIQEVGLTKNGDMGVPSNYTDVGWLKTGPRPGEPGNAVVAGHLNAGANKPAVFQNLYKIKAGGIIEVTDEKQHTKQRFKVTSIQSYDVARAPLEKIFGATTDTRLNLITCSGNWDKTKKDYDERLVVFAELVS